MPSLKYQHATSAAEALTIGSIRIDTSREHPVEYMCRETGVGSGTVWRENRLFLSYDEAMTQAAVDAAQATAKYAATPTALTTYHYSTLPLERAALGLSWDAVYRSFDETRAYRDFIEILYNDKVARNKLGPDLEHDLEDVLSDRALLRPHPVHTLIAAARAEDIQAIRVALAALPRPLPAKDSGL